MVERLRALLERPLDPSPRRAVLVLACALTAAFAALVALGAIGPGTSGSPPSRTGQPASSAAATPIASAPRPRAAGGGTAAAPPEQDPQDRPASAAAHRAERELATHRALQHVPYRRGGVAIELIGARGGRAVLEVRAASAAAARAGWHRFLRRFHDPGRSYEPIFEVSGGRGG